MGEIGIGLLGLGNVGGGVLEILSSHAGEIEARLGARLTVRRALVRDLDKARRRRPPAGLLTTDLEAVLDDPAVEIVVEVMGGTGRARDALLGAIERGKPVVTANKTLLARHGGEIFEAAQARSVDVFYEAAVGGGLPVIRTLREALASDRIERLTAILNGTTNYVLDRMWQDGLDLSEAVAEAQAAGYAEADPSADVEGRDAAEKLALLSAIAFGVEVRPEAIPTTGITEIGRGEVEAARARGLCPRLLCVAERAGGGRLTLAVRPTLVPLADPLAAVRGADNAVCLEAAALGRTFLMGAGAGALPTGSAVVADLVECARSLRLGTSGRVPARSVRDARLRPARLTDPGARRAPFLLRFMVQDRPGVLGRLATALGEAGISLAAVEQPRRAGAAEKPVPVVVVTHPCEEGALEGALERLSDFPFLAAPPRKLWLLEEAAA